MEVLSALRAFGEDAATVVVVVDATDVVDVAGGIDVVSFCCDLHSSFFDSSEWILLLLFVLLIVPDLLFSLLAFRFELLPRLKEKLENLFKLKADVDAEKDEEDGSSDFICKCCCLDDLFGDSALSPTAIVVAGVARLSAFLSPSW